MNEDHAHGNGLGRAAIGVQPASARVVLIGRTGLDGRLRLDPELELIRARSGFHAIGELANPVGQTPRRTVIIVGTGSDIEERNGGPAGFVAAVRRLAPGAVVALCQGIGANSDDIGTYDEVVSPSASSDRLRSLVHGQEPEPPAPEPPIPEPEPAPRSTPWLPAEIDRAELEALIEAEEPPDEHAPRALVPPGVDPVAAHAELKPFFSARPSEADGLLVTALLGGRDLLEPALGLIRSRLGMPSAEFHSEPEWPGGGVEVRFGGTTFGRLVVPGASSGDEPAIREQARWLGAWLALADQQRRLRVEAYTDAVSGAWNRRYFDRFLEAAIPHARARRFKLTVLVFDLDNFKSFNDRFGHEAGDMILVETVRLLKSLTRPTDRICRIGGDEFAVVFYEPDGPRDKHSDHPDAFEAVARRFQRAIVEQRFPRLGIAAPGELTISGGLATFPWDGQSAEDLLRRADQLALESKRSGKNMLTFGSRAPSGA